MTNAEKYLRDGVDVEELCLKIATEYAKGSAIDWYKHIEEAVNRFFTHQVKPTLSEDEKVILRNIDKNYKYIERSSDGLLRVVDTDTDDYIDFRCGLPYSNLFQFIKERRRI